MKGTFVKNTACYLLSFSVVVGLMTDSALAAPKSSKLRAAFKNKGLATVQSITKSLKAKKSTKKAVSAAAASAPTLLSMAEGADDPSLVDKYFFGGSLERIAGNAPTGNDCAEFFPSVGKCMVAQGTLQGLANAQSSETTSCYLSSVAKALGGVTFTGSGNARDALDPGATAKKIRINITGFSEGGQGGGGGGGGGPEEIIAYIGKQTEGVLYSAQIVSCNPETGERLSVNSIRVAKDGKITVLDSGGDESGKSAMKFVGFLDLVKGNGSYDVTKARTMTIEADREGEHGASAFNAKISILGDTITQQLVDHSGQFERKSTMKVKFAGSSLDTIRFLEGAHSGEEKFEGQAMSFASGVTWNGAEGRYVTDENSFEKAVNKVDLDGEFFSGEIDGEIEIGETKVDCDISDEALDGELSLDFSDPALAAVAAKCEPLIRNGGICFENSLFQAAQSNYNTACPNSGGPGGGGGEGGGEGGGPA